MSEERSASDNVFSGWLAKRLLLGLTSKRFLILTSKTLTISKDDKDSNYHKDGDFETLEITPDVTVRPQGHPNTSLTILKGRKVMYEFSGPPDDIVQWLNAFRSITYDAPKHRCLTDEYKVLTVIGRGFYGKVMLCQHRETNDIIAVKTVQKRRLFNVNGDTNKISAILSERNILMKIRCPFVVQLIFAFQTPSKFYFGLEYAPGGDLFHHMQLLQRIPLNTALFFTAEIAIALNHLHSNGVLYRDLKPENILLDGDGHVKLTDFGLSKDLSDLGCCTTFCGTQEYLAPEIIERKGYGPPIDWWALGVLLYEMLYGRTPFSSENPVAMYENILHCDPIFPEPTDENAKNLMIKLLNKNPSRRAKFDSIKNSPIFSEIDFSEMEKKTYLSPFKPKIHDLYDTHNFDTEFTKEAPNDSDEPFFCDEQYTRIANFSYQEPEELI